MEWYSYKKEEEKRERKDLNSYLWWVFLNNKSSLERIREYLPIMLGREISESDIEQRINILWWEKIKVKDGKIEIWDKIITSCEPQIDWNLGEYNINIDYNWRCLYDWKHCFDKTDSFRLDNDGFIVITETSVKWEETQKIIEVKRS